MALKYNLLIVGDKGVDKSAYLQRCSTGDFKTELFYDIKTVLTFNTWNHFTKTTTDKIIFYITEISNPDLLPMEEIDAVIIMFSRQDSKSLENVPNWIEKITNTYDTPNMVLCGNKNDILPILVEDSKIIEMKGTMKYYDISAKSMYNWEHPFQHLIRGLLHNPKISILLERI